MSETHSSQATTPQPTQSSPRSLPRAPPPARNPPHWGGWGPAQTASRPYQSDHDPHQPASPHTTPYTLTCHPEPPAAPHSDTSPAPSHRAWKPGPGYPTTEYFR